MKKGKKAQKNGDSGRSLIERITPPTLAVRSETKRSIIAIATLTFSLLLAVAPFGAGGVVAETLYTYFNSFFGVGYFLIPIAGILTATGLLRTPQEVEGGIKSKVFGAFVLFLAGSGLIHALGVDAGLLGYLIALPFIGLFDYTFGSIILATVAVIGVMISLDTPILAPSFAWLNFRKSEKQVEKPLRITAPQDNTAVYDDADEVEEDESEDEPAPVKEVVQKQQQKAESKPLYEPEAPEVGGFKLSDTAYTPPPLNLLEREKGKPETGDIKANANIIKRTLQNFGIMVEMDEVSIGPTVTRFALKPAEGVRLQKIVSLQNNLELALAASPVRIEAPIPGKSLVGIEVPNQKKATVALASLVADTKFRDEKRPLFAALGRDIVGAAHYANLAKMPHMLIAGATGSGKSVSIHAIITSLLYRNGPQMLRMIMIDPKRVELTLYNGIPQLLTPVITDPKKAILSLKWAAKEMDRRYNLLEKHTVRDISSYHENVVAAWKGGADEAAPDQMPYIVIVIDELADIMQTYPRELEAGIVRLAQMSRAVGIHLILSTQRPSVNVITGLIKANVPARIALQVASQIDSRTILDAPGAENLLGAGDMLFQSADMAKPHRIQTAFISEEEVKSIVKFIKTNNEPSMDDIAITAATPDVGNNALFGAMVDDEAEDDAFDDARRTVEEAGKASTSLLQRKLRLGYGRAARLMDILERKGIIGPQDGSKPRAVLTGPRAGEAPTPDDEA